MEAYHKKMCWDHQMDLQVHKSHFASTLIQLGHLKAMLFSISASLAFSWSRWCEPTSSTNTRLQCTNTKQAFLLCKITSKVVVKWGLSGYLSVPIDHHLQVNYKLQYLHFRSQAEYFLLSWKIPKVINRWSILFHSRREYLLCKTYGDRIS